MSTDDNVPDEFKKDIQRQQFIQKAKAFINKPTTEDPNLPFPLFHSAVAGSVWSKEPPPEDRFPADQKPKSYESCGTGMESYSSVASAREIHLEGKIKKLEDEINLTETRIRESQAAKQLLRTKLRILQEKIEHRNARPETTQAGEVFQLNQLKACANETLDRLKTLRELQMKEQSIKDSYNQMEKYMSVMGSSRYR